MKEELEKKFVERFKFFHPEKSPMESLICFGFECNDGWANLIWDLCEKLEEQLSKEGDDKEYPFEVVQVKEKFGGLRFYTNWGTDAVYDLIDEAEDKSFEVCEMCGKEGKLRSNGMWMKTLCEEHTKELGYKEDMGVLF